MPATPPAINSVIHLFDGSTLANWRMCGRGTFHAIDGALQSLPSFDLGLLWCTIPMPSNYRLELDFLVRLFNTNSGVFVRFRNPELAGMANDAWSAVSDGFEIQIDNTGTAPAGQPQALAKHRTGVVYAVNYPGDPSPDVAAARHAGRLRKPAGCHHTRLEPLRDRGPEQCHSGELEWHGHGEIHQHAAGARTIFPNPAHLHRFGVILELQLYRYLP